MKNLDAALNKLKQFEFKLLWSDLASEIFSDNLTEEERLILEKENDTKPNSPN